MGAGAVRGKRPGQSDGVVGVGVEQVASSVRQRRTSWRRAEVPAAAAQPPSTPSSTRAPHKPSTSATAKEGPLPPGQQPPLLRMDGESDWPSCGQGFAERTEIARNAWHQGMHADISALESGYLAHPESKSADLKKRPRWHRWHVLPLTVETTLAKQAISYADDTLDGAIMQQPPSSADKLKSLADLSPGGHVMKKQASSVAFKDIASCSRLKWRSALTRISSVCSLRKSCSGLSTGGHCNQFRSSSSSPLLMHGSIHTESDRLSSSCASSSAHSGFDKSFPVAESRSHVFDAKLVLSTKQYAHDQYRSGLLKDEFDDQVTKLPVLLKTPVRRQSSIPSSFSASTDVSEGSGLAVSESSSGPSGASPEADIRAAVTVVTWESNASTVSASQSSCVSPKAPGSSSSTDPEGMDSRDDIQDAMTPAIQRQLGSAMKKLHRLRSAMIDFDESTVVNESQEPSSQDGAKRRNSWADPLSGKKLVRLRTSMLESEDPPERSEPQKPQPPERSQRRVTWADDATGDKLRRLRTSMLEWDDTSNLSEAEVAKPTQTRKKAKVKTQSLVGHSARAENMTHSRSPRPAQPKSSSSGAPGGRSRPDKFARSSVETLNQKDPWWNADLFSQQKKYVAAQPRMRASTPISGGGTAERIRQEQLQQERKPRRVVRQRAQRVEQLGDSIITNLGKPTVRMHIRGCSNAGFKRCSTLEEAYPLTGDKKKDIKILARRPGAIFCALCDVIVPRTHFFYHCPRCQEEGRRFDICTCCFHSGLLLSASEPDHTM